MPPRARPLDDEALARVSSRARARARSGSRAVALALPVAGLGLGLALLAGAPRSARADDAPSLLVLGMQQEGRSSSRARASVIQHLQRMGEPAIGPPLGSSDLACTQSDCLGRLARTHGADRILGAEVIPNDRTYTLQVWLYDVREGQPHAVTEHCVECGADELISMLSRLSGSLVESSAAPAAPAAPTATPPAPAAPSATPESQALVAPAPAERAATAPVAGPASRCTPPYKSFGRGFAIGLHGALAAGALATGIGLHAQSGTAYEAGVSSFSFQNQYRLAYGLTGAFALGLGAALMPWQRLLSGAEASAPVCPAPRTRYTFGRGIAAGAFAGLLAGGLVSSFVLTALDGRPYGEYQGQPASFHFQPHYTAGYIASAGMALGLGLSLLIP